MYALVSCKNYLPEEKLVTRTRACPTKDQSLQPYERAAAFSTEIVFETKKRRTGKINFESFVIEKGVLS